MYFTQTVKKLAEIGYRPLMLKLLTFSTLCTITYSAQALNRTQRLGIGFANQMKNDIPSLSFKLARSKSFAIGGQLGYSSDDASGGYAAALKVYRNFFDEPQLNFYGAILGGLISEKRGTETESGFQVDLTLGSEFSFVGLESLGFSLEFGVSLNKVNDFVIETVGNNFVVSAIHFYL